MLIFFDETGIDQCATIGRYGYILRRKPLMNEKLVVRGKRISPIAFISVNGLLDCKTVNSEVFYDFIQKDSFVLSSITAWNALEDRQVDTQSLSVFKLMIKS